MSGDHRLRTEGLDPIEGSQPLVPRLGVATLREVEVRVVVDGVAGVDEADGRDMQPRRVRSIGRAELEDLQRFSLEMEGISIERLWRYQPRRKPAGKARLPDGFHDFGFDLVADGGCHACGSERPGVGESTEQ